MLTRRTQSDGFYIDYTPASAVVGGDVIVQGDLVGIADADIAVGELGALSIHGVYAVPTAVTIAVGITVYWDATAKKAVVTATGNKVLGTSVMADADNIVLVKLVG